MPHDDTQSTTRHSRPPRRRGRHTASRIGAVAASILIAALAWVAYVDTTSPIVREHVVYVAGLTRPVTVLQVTDLHGRTFGPGQSKIEKLLAGRRFDAVVMTGDYYDAPLYDPAAAVKLAQVLERHTPRVLAIVGNHDDLPARLALIRAGVRFPETQPAPLTDTGEVVALDANDLGNLNLIAASRAAVVVALRHVPPTPAEFDAARATVGPPIVFLCGHTHGGQIRVPGIGALWAPTEPQPGSRRFTSGLFPDLRGLFVDGLYLRGSDVVCVSPGLGTTYVGFRLFCRSELTVIKLLPAGK